MMGPRGCPDDRPRRARVNRGLLLLLLLTLAVFFPLLAADLVYDDQILVVRNTLTGSLANLPRFFQIDLWDSAPGAASANGYYRPLFLVDLALGRAAFGLDPLAAHLESILWHLLGGALLVIWLRRVTRDDGAALVGGALYLLHPVQLEAVAFIAARNDLMATALLLGALLVLDREDLGPGAMVGGATLLAAAGLCKESVVLAPLLLAASAWARTGRFWSLRAQLAAIGGLAVVALLRLQAGVGAPPGTSMAAIVAEIPRALQAGLSLGIWPLGRSPVSTTAGPLMPAVLGGIGLIALGLLGRRRAWGGIAFAAIALLPPLAAVARLHLFPARYLGLPMVGIALALAAASRRLPVRARPALAAGLAVLGAIGLSQELPTWANDLSFWSTAVAREPGPYAWQGLAKVQEAAGDLDAAAESLDQALAPPGPLPDGCYNAASLHLKRGDPARAARTGLEALHSGCPDSPELLGPTAIGLAATGRWEEAEALAERVEGPDPTGLAVVVRVTVAARRGDLGPFEAAAGGDPAGLAERVRWLLGQAPDAEGEAAARLLPGS